MYRVVAVALLAACSGDIGGELESEPAEASFAIEASLGACAPIGVTSVLANADDGNVPQNVLDGVTGTRWSSLGKGAWIQLDLGSVSWVRAVAIAWYKGDARTNDFDIAVSSDGNSFTTVHAGQSGGATAAHENYDFADAQARYVRVTVYGNSVNDWASITEIDALGGAQGCEQQQASDVDKFGIKKIYPTAPGGREWFMDMDDPADGELDPKEPISKQTDGSWKISASQVRMSVGTPNGKAPWKNVEMTGYIKLTGYTQSDDEFTWYARGGRHTDSDGGCAGSAYKGSLGYQGGAFFKKEVWHIGGYTNKRGDVDAVAPIKGRWVGFKVAIFNVDSNTHVRMQSFVDDAANNTWVKLNDVVDTGGWKGGQAKCGRPIDAILKNAMPNGVAASESRATFRADGATFLFKHLSIREIQAAP